MSQPEIPGEPGCTRHTIGSPPPGGVVRGASTPSGAAAYTKIRNAGRPGGGLAQGQQARGHLWLGLHSVAGGHPTARETHPGGSVFLPFQRASATEPPVDERGAGRGATPVPTLWGSSSKLVALNAWEAGLRGRHNRRTMVVWSGADVLPGSVRTRESCALPKQERRRRYRELSLEPQDPQQTRRADGGIGTKVRRGRVGAPPPRAADRSPPFEPHVEKKAVAGPHGKPTPPCDRGAHTSARRGHSRGRWSAGSP